MVVNGTEVNELREERTVWAIKQHCAVICHFLRDVFKGNYLVSS